MTADMPIVDNNLGPGTAGVHALIVGVGHYDDAAMPALASAPLSALAFAEWLRTRQQIPNVSLGSIAVLASQPSNDPVAWQGQALARPNSANLQKAVDAWHARAATNTNNLVIFYFCGHGVELGGGVQSLLLEDVDLASQDPFANGMAFNEFLRGMDSCPARRQLYVIDACRELPAGMMNWDDDVPAGRPFVRFNFKARAKLQARKNPVLQATAPSLKAWQGQEGGWFTEALLTVLDGPAGNNRLSADPNEYPVNTRDIASTIEFLVANEHLRPPDGPQSPRRAGDDDFDLHLPNPPRVPVLVTANGAQSFDALLAGAVVGNALVPPWRGQLPIGVYDFAYGQTSISAQIGVPARKVVLP
jgi:hypothetical protein